MKRYLFILLGFVSLGLGLLGIVTPGLPTTPFVLLTGVLFAKSSPRLHQKLMDNKITGPYIRRVNNGFSIRGMIISITIMWIMVGITAFAVFSSESIMRYVMLGLGGVGTVAQILVLRKKKKAMVIPLQTTDNRENTTEEVKAS